jgi:hypothetical protein
MLLPTSGVRARRRLLTASTLVGSVLALGVAGTAQADSIVFTRDANVWLAKPDGTTQYQVTRDGTTASPYSSPSQADDGTIVASKGHEIVRMRQNGSVLNRMDPPPLMNSVSHPVDGAPASVAISPDGAKIVYSLVDVQCPIGVPGCDARPATAVTPADHMAPIGTTYTFDSSWVTNTRLLTFAGYDHQVNTLDVGQPEDVHWFDDHELVGEGVPSTDQSDGEVNRQGTYVATIRGYGANRTVMWLKIRGDVRTGSRGAGTLDVPDPEVGCVTTSATDISGPTWSPSGTALAWREEGAIHVWDDASRCEQVFSKPVIPGGDEPDWGPADIAPGPREGEGTPPPAPGGGGDPSPAPQPKPKPNEASQDKTPKRTLKLAKAIRLKAALRGGFRVRITGGTPGRRSFAAKLGTHRVASGAAKVGKAGAATVTLRFTKAGRRKVAKRRAVRLTIVGAGVTGKVTLKR